MHHNVIFFNRIYREKKKRKQAELQGCEVVCVDPWYKLLPFTVLKSLLPHSVYELFGCAKVKSKTVSCIFSILNISKFFNTPSHSIKCINYLQVFFLKSYVWCRESRSFNEWRKVQIMAQLTACQASLDKTEPLQCSVDQEAQSMAVAVWGGDE